ncbi:MAG: putative lipid II flippase FtsW [Candidatus Daviesbacteria bacterium]
MAQSQGTDLILLGTVVFLSLFGLLMVYDASQFEAFQSFGDKYYYIKQQSISFILGMLLLGFCSLFNYHYLQKLAVPILVVSLVLLLFVFIPGLGISAYGAHRWLKVLGFTIQPTEILKLATVVFLATLFQKKVKSLPFFLLLGLISIIVGILQRDLGSAIVCSLIAFSIYFIAGAPLTYFFGILATGVVAVIGLIMAAPYRIRRVLAFLDPFADPQGYSYHISQVLIALGSGGLLGVGIGQSRQKFAYIPEVTTDSIFSIVGEELGFVGSLVLISLFAVLVIRGLKIAQSSTDVFGKLLAAGLTLWLGIQAAVNIAAMVSLVPLTGVPLPFISYGGSALVANLVAVGLLLNISKQAKIQNKEFLQNRVFLQNKDILNENIINRITFYSCTSGN